VNQRPVGLNELDEIDDVFSALAHPSRRQILTVLRVRGGVMTSGELASRFACSWPTTTRHLNVLVAAGLISAKKRGREREYACEMDLLVSVAGGWIDRFR